MGALEQVTQMRGQGIQDNQIIENLQQQGISPREIQDAMGQSQIKDAVAGEMPSSPQQTGGYTPKAQEIPESGIPAGTEDYSQEYGQPSQEYVQDPYAAGGYDQGYAQGPQVTDTDTLMEIAEQIFEEKIKKIRDQQEDMIEFKTLAQTKLENISERLKRMESNFDKMQLSILEKVSSFGKGIETTKKELEMVQDSFGKIVNKVTDKHPTTHHKTTSKKTHKKK